MKNFEELLKEYPMDRDKMTTEQEKDFVNHCFNLYEKEGFSKVFWSIGENFKQYNNKPFKVIGRATEEDCDLECLPMWKIQFEDKEIIHAYSYEIIPSEMIDNGCKLKVK